MFVYKTIKETCLTLNSDVRKGLTEMEAGRRLRTDGENRLPDTKRKSLPARFIEQLQDPLIYVLLAASAISLLLNEVSDTVIILFVVIMNAVIGLIQEGKAQRALDSLKKLTSPHAIVIRDGRREEIAASCLVTGDIVCLEAGCQVPADMRLLEAECLKVEESALTGESLPVEKDASFLARPKNDSHEIPLGDRFNMAYMSTIVTYGRGKGIVTATGIHTEIGKIASMIQETKEDATPLQKRLGELGTVLSLLSLLLCTLLFFIGIWQHRNLFEMLITAISLAVAAVPEGLPAIVTICLALSVTRMVKVNTIIRRLPSVETLGSVSVICSDKTGTLTQNRMTVRKLWLPEGRGRQELLTAAALCCDAQLRGTTVVGEATERALVEAALQEGLEEACSLAVVQSVHEQLRERLEEHRDSKDPEPLAVTAKEVGGILRDCGVAEEQVEAFCQSCGKQFGEGAALAPANLIDSRRFEVKTGEATISLAPERSYLVEDRVIDGRRYLLIPVDETLEVNGLPVE